MAGNSVLKNLTTTMGALSARMRQTLYSSNSGQQSSRIQDIDPASWPNPLQPIAPFGPPGAKPLAFSFWEGQNTNYTPRPDAEYTASELRALSQYPLARICIENVKDIVCQTPWQIGLKAIPGETQRERASRQKGDENIINLSRFFERPDREPNSDWSQWSRILVENMLTIDAGSVLVERSKRGRVRTLQALLDGGAISRYVNDRGMTPQPPDVAYAQLWNGLPRVDLTTDQLIYGVRNIVPRNTLSSYLYGMGPTEQLAQYIKVGQERLNFVQAYYTSGSIPDVIQIAPPGANPDDVASAMKVNNSILSGNPARRRMWTILQGMNTDGRPDQILFPKEPLLADTMDDMLIRIICYGYGDSAHRLMKQMNRSSSESSQTASEEEGITPWVIWLKSIMNTVIQIHMGMDAYEMSFKMERESDILKIAQTDSLYVKNGGYTWNERREMRGDDPRPEPDADKLGIITANGWLELGANIQIGGGGDSKPQDTNQDGNVSHQTKDTRTGDTAKALRLVPRT